jgi:imidazolonepropionase
LVTNDPALVESASGKEAHSVTVHGDAALGVIPDAALLIRDGRVVYAGPAATAPRDEADRVEDVGGRTVLPGFVDSHTHLVFAGDRAQEFAARMSGRRYEAGGIRTTVAATRQATVEDLTAHTAALVAEARRRGTTTLEIKTGYGLDVATETRLARVARRFTEEVTFLGAHVVAPEFAGDPEGYVDLVTGPMLAAVAPYARWIDVFCETGAFTADQGRRVLEAGRAAGLGGRLHAAQLGPGEAVRMGVELGVASLDHGTFLTDADVALLADSDTVVTLLPGAEFSTRQPYPDARRLADAGVTLALASDCNPGTSFTTSLPFCLALAVREMGLTPAEALLAATRGGARALRRTDIGHLGVGARADYTVLDAPSWLHLFYRPGVHLTGVTPSAVRSEPAP